MEKGTNQGSFLFFAYARRDAHIFSPLGEGAVAERRLGEFCSLQDSFRHGVAVPPPSTREVKNQLDSNTAGASPRPTVCTQFPSFRRGDHWSPVLRVVVGCFSVSLAKSSVFSRRRKTPEERLRSGRHDPYRSAKNSHHPVGATAESPACTKRKRATNGRPYKVCASF